MLPLSVVDESKTSNGTMNLKLRDEDLHIFILDGENLKSSITILENHMKRRQRFNREFWLIDISALESIENAQKFLNSLYLDFDDDILPYILDKPGKNAKLWEIYKMGPDKDLLVRALGKWDQEKGIQMINPDKWLRRGNLMVIRFFFSKRF